MKIYIGITKKPSLEVWFYNEETRKRTIVETNPWIHNIVIKNVFFHAEYINLDMKPHYERDLLFKNFNFGFNSNISKIKIKYPLSFKNIRKFFGFKQYGFIELVNTKDKLIFNSSNKRFLLSTIETF